MKDFSSSQFGISLFLLLAVSPPLSAAEPTANPVPPATPATIDFDRDIRPILENSCIRCHGPEKPRSGFHLSNRVAALRGGDDNTNDIVPGDSSKSLLINYVSRKDPDMDMPPDGKGDPLTAQQIGLLRAWIDQGANWNTTNQAPQLTLEVAPTSQWIDVQGNKSKFRELEGQRDGYAGGLDHFSLTEQLSPDEKLSLNAHVLEPGQDLDFQVALDKTDVGFIHSGFTEWRKYYSSDGGYDPAFMPAGYTLDRDLYIDNGRAWIDFGLALPRLPLIVLGYEYQFRNGNESSLDWGPANGANIYPSVQSLDEGTHIVKLSVTHDFDDWHLDNHARVEISTLNDGDGEGVLTGGSAPGVLINTKDDYHSVEGMDTLTLEKQIRNWWFLSGGFYFSKLSATDLFSQSTTFVPPSGFNLTPLSSEPIGLSRESEIFSISSLFTPLKYLTLSLGTQNEWTRETGFGASVPDLELGGTMPASSSSDLFKSSQTGNLRYTLIPYSVLFADAELSQETISQYEAGDPAEFEEQSNVKDNRYDVTTGFNTSPWRWFALNAQFERKSSQTDYNYPVDVYNGLSGGTNGYPGFILDREIKGDDFETKLDLRLAKWLRTTLTYQISDTDYSSTTEPAFVDNLLVSTGGAILDGREDQQTYGFGATLTPIQQLFFSGSATYTHSRTVTADNDDPSLVPYTGDIFTMNATATYAWNEKTALQVSYIYTKSDYGQNNAGAGVPLGLDFTRNELRVGLSRQLTKRLTGSLHYQFSQYDESNTGTANNFTANGVFLTLAYKWP